MAQKAFWDVVDAWKDKGGKHYWYCQSEEFNSSQNYRIRFNSDGTAEGVASSGGVCFFMAREWLRLRNSRNSAITTMESFKSGRPLFIKCKGKQTAQDHASDELWDITGLSSRITKRGFWTRTLTSRKKVANTVYDGKGLFHYSAWDKQSESGHSVAFDSRGDSLHFMDPNCGVFYFVEGRPSKSWFANWFYDFWDNRWLDYKNSFHKGDRALCNYARSMG